MTPSPQGHRHKIPTAQAGTRTLLSVYVVANEAALLRPGGGAVSQSAQAAETISGKLIYECEVVPVVYKVSI